MYHAITDYLEGLEVTQGQLRGTPLSLMPWQRRDLKSALQPGISEAALSMARGGGKSTLIAGIGCAFLEADGVKQPGSEITVIAATLGQGQIIFDHVLRFLGPRVRSFSKKHSEQRMQLRAQDTTMLRVVGSNPSSLHGAAPSLVIADEIAQWAPNKALRMLSALRTGLGKIPDARMLTLGTRAATAGDPWEQSLRLADITHSYSAPLDAPPFQLRTWKLANPTLRSAGFDTLVQAYRKDAARAKRDPDLFQSFKALRLNQGVSEVLEAYVVDVGTYEACVDDGLKGIPMRPYVLGIDLGGTAAMSGAAAYSVATGALEVFAMLPNKPDLADRELQDGVAGLYRKMEARGELICSGEYVVPVAALLEESLARWGVPTAIVCDRWRIGELQEGLQAISFPQARLQTRGQGFKDGAEDVRHFRRAFISRVIRTPESLLLTSAINEARLVSDPSGNQKLSKNTEGGRRKRGRDDALAACILAVAEGVRMNAMNAGGSMVYHGAVK